jgi:flagellar basal body-associated protein FliL
MELFDTLASVGLTTRVLQIIIIFAIVIVLLGIFWRYIVFGFGILFCVYVFAVPSSKPVEVVKVETPEVKQVEPLPPVAEVKPNKPQTDEEMFVEDCQLQTKYTQAQCKALWNEHKDEIEAIKYRGKNNKQYMKKVKYGI